MGGRTFGRSRWASLAAVVLCGGVLVTAAPPVPVSATSLPLTYEVTAQANGTPATLESAAFQWCGPYLVAGCGEMEALSGPVESSSPPNPTSVFLNARCLLSACMGVADAAFGTFVTSVNGHSPGWTYQAGPGIVLMTAQNYVPGESITLDGMIVGSGIIFAGQCFLLPRNWSLVYVHHLTVELHADGSYRVTVPDAKEPVTDPTSGKRCQRDELLVHSATWSGQAPPGSFVIP